MYKGTQFWQDRLPSGLIKKEMSDGRIIETFPDMPQSLYEFLEQTSVRKPEHTALSDDLGRELTYRELKEKVDHFADYLEGQMALPAGAHIGLMALSTVEYVTAFLAIHRIGAIAVILPTKFKQLEILSLVGRASLDCLICDQRYEAWFDEFPGKRFRILSYKPEPSSFALDSFRTQGTGTCYPPRTSYEAVCTMMFTSGTTSMSKGVLLTNYNFVHSAGVYRMAFDITGSDRTVISVPIYTITALAAVIGTYLLVGGTIYLQRKFDAKQVLSCIFDNKLTYIHAAPTVASFLLEEKDRFPVLPSLKKMVCGGSRMPLEKIRQLHMWLPGCEYHNVYGMTETTSPGTIQKENAINCEEMASEGFPVPGLTFKVLDENGRELPPGEAGEIYVSGTNIMSGYYDLDTPDFQNGWLATGDIGYFTPSGYCYIIDRKKDMINRGGEKMTSYDVEEELYAMGGIAEAVVVGIPDEMYGEVPAALIKPEKECAWDEAGIRGYLRNRIAKYKIPVRIIFTNEIPLSSGGKPDRKRIRQLLADGANNAGSNL